MSKQNLVNIGLLLLIGVLVLLVVYEPGIEAPEEPPSLLEINREAVKSIRIERKDQEKVVLARNKRGDWQLTEPLTIAANDFRISSLLRITELKSLGSYPVDSENIVRFGLDEPGIRLTLNDNPQPIVFGDSTPLDQRRYVQVGDRIHLINDTLYYHLIGSFASFISSELLPQGASITALSLPELTLRLQEKQWQVDPKPEPFSADQVTRLIDAWKLASAMQVKPYDGSKGDPITIELKDDKAPITFLITAHAPDLVLARPELGIEYHLAESTQEELLTLPELEKAAE